MPDPRRLLNTLHQAEQAFQTTPGRRGRFLELSDAESVLVAGDLHGNLDNFKRILQLADLGNQPRRHLVLQELIHGSERYANSTAETSHRLVDVVAALKCQYPRRVHVLLGNHELSQWTDRAIMKDDQDLNEAYRAGIEQAYGEHAADVYAAHVRLFAAMTVVIRLPNRVVLSHSLPGLRRLDSWDWRPLCRDDITPKDVSLGGCIHAVVWGRDLSQEAAERYLAKLDADWLISGHIPCDDGFIVPNDRQLILDCKGSPACCCLVPTDRPVTQAELIQAIHRIG